MTASPADQPVLIVGAGPVGLCTALRLAQFEIPSIVVEKEDELPRGLRASTFHPPTLEMLDLLGLAEPLIELGLRVDHWQIRLHETHEHARFELRHLAGDTRFPFRLQVEQWKLCALAAGNAEANPLIDMRLGTAMSSLRQDTNNVTATLRDTKGRESTLVSPLMIAADGARGSAREQAGIEFEGHTYPETTILATTKFPFEEHLPDLSPVNYVWFSHGTFSLLKLPDTWRCSLYPDDGESVADALRPDSVETKLQRIVRRRHHYEVDEIRSYQVHQRLARNYRAGRVLLAGDAAHLNSPSGGMGMNGGIHDAFRLAENIPAVYRGTEPVEALDRYTQERRPVAEQQILAQAHANRTRMQQRDSAWRRAELLRLQAIADDDSRCRAYLLKSSMIEGLRTTS